jgi:hypothetical protein
MQAATDAERTRLVHSYFGSSKELSEADIIELSYSEEELEQTPDLRTRYKCLKQEEALAEAAAYIARARDDRISVPKELVWLVAHCEDLLKRNEQLAEERDGLLRKLARYRARDRAFLLPIELRSLLRILGAIVTSPPYNFDLKMPKNKATTRIFNLTEENEVDQDTVRKWVLEAANEIARCREARCRE